MLGKWSIRSDRPKAPNFFVPPLLLLWMAEVGKFPPDFPPKLDGVPDFPPKLDGVPDFPPKLDGVPEVGKFPPDFPPKLDGVPEVGKLESNTE